MSLSAKVCRDVQFLNGLDPNVDSMTMEEDEWVKIGRRSALFNFCWTVIHYLTLTLISRNKELDQISREFFKNLAEEIEEATGMERDLAESAVRGLSEIIAYNGGSEGEEAAALLATIDKIRQLPAVQKLAGSPVSGKEEVEGEEAMPITPPRKLDSPKIGQKSPRPKPENAKLEQLDELIVDRPLLDELHEASEMSDWLSILEDSQEVDHVVEEMLKAHPLRPGDPDDAEYRQFMQDLIIRFDPANPKVLYQVLVSLCKHASDERQAILFYSISARHCARFIEDCPPQAFQKHGASILNVVAWSVKTDQSNAKALKAFARCLSGDQLFELAENDSDIDFYKAVLPFTQPATQQQFVNRALDALDRSRSTRTLLEEIQWSLADWVEASKLNPCRKYYQWDLAPTVRAAIANGQVGNHPYLRQFFKSIVRMSKEDFNACVEELKPDVFQFEEPESLSEKHWEPMFIKFWNMSDQKRAKELLIAMAIHLFNSQGFDAYGNAALIGALNYNHKQLLPLERLTRPDVRLVLAILSDRLDDQMIETASDVAACHEEFFSLFRPVYQVSLFNYNTLYPKKFLTWLLDRP